MNEVPDGTVNLYGPVHNNEPLREGPYVNICVEHTEYRPLPLDAVRRLALARLAARGRGRRRRQRKSVAWTSSRPRGKRRNRKDHGADGAGIGETRVSQHRIASTGVVPGTT